MLVRWLGFEKVELEDPGVKFYPEELTQRLGRGRKLFIKEGDLVLEQIGRAPSLSIKSRILKKYTDLLGNEIYLTSFRRSHILGDLVKRKLRNLYVKELRKLGSILKDPDVILFDRLEGAWIYGKRRKEWWCFVVVGDKDRKVFTMIIRSSIFKRKDRYEVLYVK